MWEMNPTTTLKRLLDCYWDGKNSQGLKPWKLYDKNPDDICNKYKVR
jgi:hypothetical protein